MESNQQYDPNLMCPICLQLAKNALESQCCGHLFCQNCVGKLNIKFKQCPCCKNNQFKVKQSKIARRMISGIKIKCPNQCQTKLQFGDLDHHRMKCPLQLIKCIFCQKIFKRKQIAQHTFQNHKQQVKKHIIQIHTKKQQPKFQQKQQGDPYCSSKINRLGVRAQIGQTGKYYCGSKLIGKCSCCDGHCGPINGQNCDACMQLDVKKFHLAKNYLLNPSGILCVYNPSTKHFCCGRTSQSKTLFSTTKVSCLNQNQCSECQKIDFSISIGRYKNLIDFE